MAMLIFLLAICLSNHIVFSFRAEEQGPTNMIQPPVDLNSKNFRNERILQSIDEFQSFDGSFKLPLSYNGDWTWSARIPIPDTSSIKTAQVSFYSDISWFYGNDEIATQASCHDDRSYQDLLFDDQIEGAQCTLLTKLSKKNEVNYKFLYSSNSNLPLPAGTLGIIGLGISQDSLPLQIKPESQMFSVYLNQDYRIPSYILFGQVDKSFVENEPPKIVQSISSKNWTFTLSNFKIVQNPSSFSLKTQSQALLDLSHNFIGVPYQYFEGIFFNQNGGLQTCSVEPSKTSLLCDCSELRGIQDFEFKLGNKNLLVPSSALVEDVSDERCRLKLACVTSSSLTPNCLLVNQHFENVWILGSPFLSYFHTLFSYKRDSQNAEVSFYVAKTQVDMRQVFKDKLAKEQPNAMMNTLKDLATVLAAFAVLLTLYFVMKKFFAFIIEKKKRYYQNYQEDELEEDDQTASQIENDNL